VPTVIKALSGELIIGSWVKTMLIGNIAMFLPLGFFLPFVTEKVNRKIIFAAAIVVPFTAELLQMIFGRSFDVDDLICNFIGIVTGFFISYSVRGFKRNKDMTS
jgi:glycopeptide antibiotics resistance protein